MNTEEDDEWERATRERLLELSAESKSRATSDSTQISPISFLEVYDATKEDEALWTPHLATIKRVVEKKPWWSVLPWIPWLLSKSDISEGPDFCERDFIFCLQSVPLNHQNELHRRALITMYRALTRRGDHKPDPSTVGGCWERLGFQGADPASDLRDMGMFGLFQILYLIDYFPKLMKMCFSVSVLSAYRVPFVLVSLNMTSIAIEALRERLLHSDIQKRRQRLDKNERKHYRIGTPVTESVCEFYVGCLSLFFKRWCGASSREVTEFSHIKNDIRSFAKTHAPGILREACKGESSSALIASKVMSGQDPDFKLRL